MTGLDALKRINEIDRKTDKLYDIITQDLINEEKTSTKIKLLNEIIDSMKEEQEELFKRLDQTPLKSKTDK
ncbi:hypothetical protein [Niallia taxi]|uniref:hypothetical protein n=1 Tax=Niallia taxi TaxID=2499688 RepID=UPI00300B49D6